MGIADRSYMRGRPPVGERLSATAWTLGVLIGTFVLGLIGTAARVNFFDGWGLSETQPRFWQPLSYACLHGDFWHLLGNGLLLWWTGDIVERTYGRRVFWLTLALGALAGAAPSLPPASPSPAPAPAPASSSLSSESSGDWCSAE